LFQTSRRNHSALLVFGPVGGRAVVRLVEIAEKASACRSNSQSLVESRPWGLKRLDHGSDVSVFENRASVLPRSVDGGIYHGPRKIVGANHLVGKQYPKRGVDRAQEAVAEIWFLPGLDGVDVRGSENVNVREARRE
jgi:hypothetical protein